MKLDTEGEVRHICADGKYRFIRMNGPYWCYFGKSIFTGHTMCLGDIRFCPWCGEELKADDKA